MSEKDKKRMVKTIDSLRWRMMKSPGTGQPGTWETGLDDKLADAQKALENN